MIEKNINLTKREEQKDIEAEASKLLQQGEGLLAQIAVFKGKRGAYDRGAVATVKVKTGITGGIVGGIGSILFIFFLGFLSVVFRDISEIPIMLLPIVILAIPGVMIGSTIYPFGYSDSTRYKTRYALVGGFVSVIALVVLLILASQFKIPGLFLVVFGCIYFFGAGFYWGLDYSKYIAKEICHGFDLWGY